MGRQRPRCKVVEFSAFGICLQLPVPALGHEGLEPVAELFEVLGGKFLDRLFDLSSLVIVCSNGIEGCCRSAFLDQGHLETQRLLG